MARYVRLLSASFLGQSRYVQAVLLEKLAKTVSLYPCKLRCRRERLFRAHQFSKECTLKGIDRALLCCLKVVEGIEFK